MQQQTTPPSTRSRLPDLLTCKVYLSLYNEKAMSCRRMRGGIRPATTMQTISCIAAQGAPLCNLCNDYENQLIPNLNKLSYQAKKTTYTWGGGTCLCCHNLSINLKGSESLRGSYCAWSMKCGWLQNCDQILYTNVKTVFSMLGKTKSKTRHISKSEHRFTYLT